MPIVKTLKRYFAGRKSFPDDYERILYNRVRVWSRLNSQRKRLLKERMKIFMSEKIFEECGGLRLTTEMKVVISAYACVLILEEPSDYYPGLQSILVYPDDYIAPVYEHNPGGIITEGNERRQGESWESGNVVLSWADIERTTLSGKNNQNLVVHEFAHQLDMQYGLSGGITLEGEVLKGGDEWTMELAKTYRKLVDLERFGREDDLLDIYGAANPSECFAVIMEAFLESPRELSIKYSRLYRMLSDFFKLDPERW